MNRCEYQLDPGGCELPGVVTVRVDPALYPGAGDVVVGTFCAAHASRLHHHTVTQEVPR